MMVEYLAVALEDDRGLAPPGADTSRAAFDALFLFGGVVSRRGLVALRLVRVEVLEVDGARRPAARTIAVLRGAGMTEQLTLLRRDIWRLAPARRADS